MDGEIFNVVLFLRRDMSTSKGFVLFSNLKNNNLKNKIVEKKYCFSILQIFSLRVAIFYDDAFRSFAGSDAAAQTKLTGIFNHIKTIYTQFSVSGVSGAVKPSLKSINYRSGRWTADSSLR